MQSNGTENAELIAWLAQLSDLATFAQVAKKEEGGRYVEALSDLLQSMPAKAVAHGLFALNPNRVRQLLDTQAFDALAIALVPEALDYTLSYSQRDGFLGLFHRRGTALEVISRGQSMGLLLVSGIAQMIYGYRYEIVGS